jgi:hypothetical protein
MKLHPITEWLAAKPDRSIAALARAAGVSRQSLHSVCGGYRNRLGADACRVSHGDCEVRGRFFFAHD